MSASGKLKLLSEAGEGEVVLWRNGFYEAPVILWDIFPFVIEVVKAAETEDSITHPEALGRPRGPIRHALVALNEALDA